MSSVDDVGAAPFAPGTSRVTSPVSGSETSSDPSGAQASRRAFGTRAHTVTVQPAGARTERGVSNGASPIPGGTTTGVWVSPAVVAAIGAACEDAAAACDGPPAAPVSDEHAAASSARAENPVSARRAAVRLPCRGWRSGAVGICVMTPPAWPPSCDATTRGPRS